MKNTTILNIKICSKCKQQKSVDKFSKDQTKKDGLYPSCKLCVKLYEQSEKGKCARQRAEEKRHKTLKWHLSNCFHNMRKRCNNSNVHNYSCYGGRGIKCLFTLIGFRNYVKNNMGIISIQQIKGLQIDRINNNGHYEPGNIRFVTAKVNANNRRR